MGAGFTGTEMMGELAEYVPILCEEFEIDRELVSLYLADMLPRAVPNLPEKLSKKIQKRLERAGVRLFLNSDVVKVGEDFIELDCGGERRRVDTDTVIWAAGIESSRLAGALAGKLPAGEHNRLKTDRYLRSLDDQTVYVVGGTTCITSRTERNARSRRLWKTASRARQWRPTISPARCSAKGR